MLLKSTQIVAIPRVDKVDYRPYSKTCPPPPPTQKHRVKKLLCGTYQTSLLFARRETNNQIYSVYVTTYDIPGLYQMVTYSEPFKSETLLPDGIDPTTAYQPVLDTGPFCLSVYFYE